MAGVDKGDQLRRYYRLRLKFIKNLRVKGVWTCFSRATIVAGCESAVHVAQKLLAQSQCVAHSISHENKHPRGNAMTIGVHLASERAGGFVGTARGSQHYA